MSAVAEAIRNDCDTPETPEEHAVPTNPILSLTFCLLALLSSAPAQTAPTIQKIDPPNWFAAMPSPMLLIQGTGLQSAKFTLSDKSIAITRTTLSPNGHWAILLLDTHTARPSTLSLTATTANGTATVPYTLKPRRPRAEAPSGFSSRDVLYLIMPDRFSDGDPTNNQPSTYNRADPHAYHGGDLRGILNHLDYIQQLGVTALWLTPILANNPKGTDYHGYGATDMYSVEPRLGTLAVYRELSGALHQRHMKLVFDDVPNHVGQTTSGPLTRPSPTGFTARPLSTSTTSTSSVPPQIPTPPRKRPTTPSTAGSSTSSPT